MSAPPSIGQPQSAPWGYADSEGQAPAGVPPMFAYSQAPQGQPFVGQAPPGAAPPMNPYGVQPQDGMAGAHSFVAQPQVHHTLPGVGGPEGGAAAGPPGGGLTGDPFSGMMASTTLQYAYGNIQRGQQFFQSKMGVLSGGTMFHLFNVTSEYVKRKLLLLFTPYLKKWDYTRHPEQVAGGQKYVAPRHDVNAPDLYIPFMALFTYCLIVSALKTHAGAFTPETMYNTAWYALVTWVLEFVLLKAVLYMLGIASYVPWLELASYSGYMFTSLSVTLLIGAIGGSTSYYIMWAYSSVCMAVFLVRTMKRIIFHEVRQYGVDRTMHNYLLLGVAAAQFPLGLWMGHV
uniref:Uncharacterized protein n=1 Tax=Tetraselmis chuii TaxID=63592 RepID=A0A7S1X8F4_9CHLO|mmetsp:Transcript_39879/g.71599  ORF Transcript_39879/g.71599 Transcript_39879/m.71599 type:complete len:344 (+) Transcript_39879:218-1249(+)